MRLANTIVVTLRPSRACVQSDCSVYIALPSPTMQITLRSGHATAAPVATGVENPIEPPMFCSQSCGAAAAVGGKKPRPGVTGSSATMAFSGVAIAVAWGNRAGGGRRRKEAAAGGDGFIDHDGVFRDRHRDRLGDRGMGERAGRFGDFDQ